MKRIALLSVAFATMITIGCGGDRPNDDAARTNEAIGTAGDADPAKTADRGTQNFVEEMMTDGLAEVELGKLASDHAQSAEVKQFAQTMVTDHSKAGEELKQITAQHHINAQAPMQLDEKHRELKDKLSKLHGAEFDREYMKAMVDGHQDVLDAMQTRVDNKLFGAERDKNVQPESSDKPAEYAVNAWAAKTLPKVREHLDRAKQVRDNLSHRTTN
jgi:putative membrane protein